MLLCQTKGINIMKKTAVFFFILLLLLCLCACGDNSDNGKQAPTPALESDPLSADDYVESGALSADVLIE